MKRIISTILTFVLLFCAAVYGVGCEETGEVRYNTIVLGGTNIMNEDFLYKKENMINCGYKNRDYNPDDPSSDPFICDPTLPSYRIIRITEQMLSNEVFEEVPVVDLETKMVLILLFSMYGSYECRISDIILENAVLKITIKSKHKGPSEPSLVCGVIMLDKLDYTESELIFTKK